MRLNVHPEEPDNELYRKDASFELVVDSPGMHIINALNIQL